ncbi:MAG TPA: amidohydrolase family protein [Streptosporangiaceae bacterium]|nr:amidohydrolase family protein [Streptosporangiaceae bacterium]
MHRVAAEGCHAVTFSENPAKLGFPSYHSDHWDSFWAACADMGTIVCLHIGSSSAMPTTADDAPPDVGIMLTPMNLFSAAADVLYSPVMRKFPTLRFALSEGGIGWIPYFLERVDWSFERQRHWTGSDFGGRRPSEVFHERFVTCFIDDKVCVRLRDEVGIDSITWECDDWRGLLDTLSGVWAPLQSPVEVRDDPQVLANGYLSETVGPGATFDLVASPVQFGRRSLGQLRAAPALGAEGDDLLSELGLSDEELIDLKISGALL